ncbi:hypothetical protein [Burkholderia seminalis]|uniref:Uncharacterized protein n=2 Tax=Burkholderia cepacia complex TaxID=87882 RepID=A0A8A8DDX6_9BURK|nr:hypothetical protein [Burkholderia seminalis]QTO23305.1 hypothetical protein DT99_035130 [Burkholderia seminalis]
MAPPCASRDGWRTRVGRRDFSAFYGHNLPAPPARLGSDERIQVCQYYGRRRSRSSLRGERYVDDCEMKIEETIVPDTAR